MNRSSRFVALLALLLAGGCGPSLQTAERGPRIGTASDPVLVAVVDGRAPQGMRAVSLSVWDVHPSDALPETAPRDVVESMRAEAAERGATHLHVQRTESPWRKAFYGRGLAPLPANNVKPASAQCEGGAFTAGLAAANKQAARCIKGLLQERPALKGNVEVLFEVDSFGRTLYATPSAGSSRDGQVQSCALDALFDADLGEPTALTCRGRFSMPFPMGH